MTCICCLLRVDVPLFLILIPKPALALTLTLTLTPTPTLTLTLTLTLATQVLTTGSWPTQTAAKCNLPRELEQCCKSFQDYYLKAHSGRKLSWQTNMGNADLKASCRSCLCEHALKPSHVLMSRSCASSEPRLPSVAVQIGLCSAA